MPTKLELEMARGAEVAARNAANEKAALAKQLDIADWAVQERRDVLTRWIEAKKLTLVRNERGDEKAYVAGTMVVAERRGPAWPSENYVAMVALAIGALSSFEGVKEHTEEMAHKLRVRKHRDEMRARAAAGRPTSWE